MTALPTLKQLQYLIALAEQLNFTRAAQSCFVTQSTLSAGLKELEATLGTQLVERDRQSVVMTPTGLDVTQRARSIVAATQDLVERAAQTPQAMCGQLRLGVIPTIAPFLLAQSLPLLRRRYPQLRLALREDLTAHLLTRLENGQIDFALIALPYATGNLAVETLFDEALWVVGRRDDPLLAPATVSATPALAERLLLLEEGHCLRDHALYACGQALAHSALGIEATSLLTLVQMVESGFGIGLVPAMAVNSGLTQSPALRLRPLAPPAPLRTIALVARRSTSRLTDLKALANVLREAGTSANVVKPG
jgi:LysR family hydrogen peroxide-inducible transcriptional activator